MSKFFLKLPGGECASLFQLRNASGFGADITDFGGAVTAIYAPGRDGTLIDVALGWRDPQTYLANPGYLGALVGRVANRVGGGRFSFDGEIYQMMLNDGNRHNSLHGGFGYSHRLWRAAQIDPATLELRLESPDGDAGYPGRLEILVTYRVTENNSLAITYHAECDRPTVVNMTNHTYFNLNGENSGSCDDLEIRIAAERRTEVDQYLTPTGRMPLLAGTPYDLKNFRSFSDIRRELPNGFDDNLILAEAPGTFRERIAEVRSSRTGIVLEVGTDMPGIQFYMGGFLDGAVNGKSLAYPAFSGFCLETQMYPDAVNHPKFPSIRLEPGESYSHRCVYHFTVR